MTTRWDRRVRFGVWWQVEYKLRPGYTTATWTVPKWAQSPTAGIIGDWDASRKRLAFLGIPLTRWQTV